MAETSGLGRKNLDYIRKVFENRGDKIIGSLADRVNIAGAERVSRLRQGEKVLYVGNHQSFGDIIIPHWAILKLNLPFPRSVAKVSLSGLAFNSFMQFMLGFDIREFGILSVNNRETGVLASRNYYKDTEKNFQEGSSLLVYPEAHRYANQDRMPSAFHDLPFAAACGKEEESRPDKLVCFGCYYERIPEVEASWAYNFGKTFGDLYSPVRWRFVKNKGAVNLAFGEPLDFKELAGEGRRGECAKRVRMRCETEVRGLINEAMKG